ncbi:MAG: hypothetical protein ACKESB_00925 [Candidatus Hodgkinia cicadicola]
MPTEPRLLPPATAVLASERRQLLALGIGLGTTSKLEFKTEVQKLEAVTRREQLTPSTDEC